MSGKRKLKIKESAKTEFRQRSNKLNSLERKNI